MDKRQKGLRSKFSRVGVKELTSYDPSDRRRNGSGEGKKQGYHGGKKKRQYDSVRLDLLRRVTKIPRLNYENRAWTETQKTICQHVR